MRIAHEPPLDGISVDVVPVTQEILVITNAMIGESALPDFTLST